MQKSYLEVNLKAVENNLKKIKKIVGEKVNVAPVIKADAYGLGATKLKNILEKQNIKMCIVATIDEAIKLRRSGFKIDILTLNELLPYEAPKVVKYNLTVGLSDLEVAKKINDEVEKYNENAESYNKSTENSENKNNSSVMHRNRKINIHIEIDTGMGRVGINPKNALEFMKEISKLPNLNVEGIYTHFSSADCSKEYTEMQINLFNKTIDELKKSGYEFKYIHSSASSGILNFKNAYFNMVRPGIITYGYMPDKSMENTLKLEPATKLISHIIFIKEVPEGTAISYGRTYIAKEKRTIATIPLGYADGVKRILSNKGKVYINGKYAPIVGNVCMDNFMVDITGINARVGDEVILWDNENITVEEIADLCNTINYEIICTISKRVGRKYI